jgi:hypothetical protein
MYTVYLNLAKGLPIEYYEVPVVNRTHFGRQSFQVPWDKQVYTWWVGGIIMRSSPTRPSTFPHRELCCSPVTTLGGVFSKGTREHPHAVSLSVS